MLQNALPITLVNIFKQIHNTANHLLTTNIIAKYCTKGRSNVYSLWFTSAPMTLLYCKPLRVQRGWKLNLFYLFNDGLYRQNIWSLQDETYQHTELPLVTQLVENLGLRVPLD